jgi:hypothetical protein
MYRPDMQKIGACTVMNTMPAIGPCISFDRRNTIRSTSATIKSMSENAKWSGSAGKTANGMRSAVATMITTEDTDAGMTGTSGDTDMKAMNATINERARSCAASLLAAGTLLLMPCVAVHAAEDAPHESAIATHARAFGAAVRHDSQVVGAKCKEGAHRVAAAAREVAHEVATAAKRGAAQTRAAFHGEKAAAPAS